MTSEPIGIKNHLPGIGPLSEAGPAFLGAGTETAAKAAISFFREGIEKFTDLCYTEHIAVGSHRAAVETRSQSGMSCPGSR